MYNVGRVNMTGNYGWICPECGRVLAPWVYSCGCKYNYKVNWVGSSPNTTDKPIYPNNGDKPYPSGYTYC